MGFLSRLIAGMKNTKKSFGEKLKYAFTGNDIDQDFYDELEFVLVSSDVGASTTEEILENLKALVKKNKVKTTDACRNLLKEVLVDILTKAQAKDFSYPCVIMVVGVNGVGKTTTIGKIAERYAKAGKNPLVVAGDTFRAAAGEQLEVWAKRAKVKIVGSTEGADPASVVFDGLASAKARKNDVVIIDTAGRLHNKVNLMEELKKMDRIIQKQYPEAEYHKMIVVDGTTGQNALSQVELFDEAIGLTDIAVTKLDGTSKGGFVFALAQNYDMAIRFVGVGETADDLLDFNAKEFVDSIFE
ncbi:MAG: signal recognition particle-docking protein FtsY [Clostridia bacterium]|nr:signal recognition particle-docking protein FtsY [Clostridia bacterium]